MMLKKRTNITGKINNTFVRNAIKSFGSITKQAVENTTPNLTSIKENLRDNKVFASKAEPSRNEKNIKNMYKKAVKFVSDEVKNIDNNENLEDEYYNEDEYSDKEKYSFMDNVVSVKKEYYEKNEETVSQIITDYTSAPISKAFGKSVSGIYTHLNKTLILSANILNNINRFDNDVEINFFDSVSQNLDQSINLFDNINSSLVKYSEARIGNFESDNYKNELEMLIKADKYLTMNNLTNSLKKGIENLTMGMDSDMLKSMVSAAIINPLGGLIRAGVSLMIPTKFKTFTEHANDTVKNINNFIFYNLLDFKKSNNPLIKMVGDKILPGKTKSKLIPYKKGAVRFDGSIKRSITHVIPTLLSKWLTNISPENYPNELVYDYHNGRFFTKDKVDEYNKKYDILDLFNQEDRVHSMDDATDFRKKLRERHSEIGRFSNEEFYKRKLYMKIPSSSNIGNKLEGWINDKMSNSTKNRNYNIITRTLNGIANVGNKGIESIDKILFKYSSSDKILSDKIDNIFGVGNNIFKENGSIDFKSVVNESNKIIINPFKEYLNNMRKENKSLFRIFIINPSMKLLESIKEPFMEEFAKKEGEDTIFSRILYSTKRFVRDKITIPLTTKLAGIKTFFFRRLSVFADKVVNFMNKTFNLDKNKDKTKKKGKTFDFSSASLLLSGSKSLENINTSQLKKFSGITLLEKIRIQNKKIVEDNKPVIMSAYNNFDKVTYNINTYYKMMYQNADQISDIDYKLAKYLNLKGIEGAKSVNNKLKRRTFTRIEDFIGIFTDVLFDGINFMISKAELFKPISLFKKTVKKTFKQSIKMLHATLDVANKVVETARFYIDKGSKILGTGIEIGLKATDKFLKFSKSITFKVLDKIPKGINVLGNIAYKIINKTSPILIDVTKGVIKTASKAVTFGLGILKLSTGLVKGLADCIANRKRLFIWSTKVKDYVAEGVGGKLDYIKPFEYAEQAKNTAIEHFKEEDEDDKNDLENNNKKANYIKGIISSRIKTRNKRINKMLDTIISGGIRIFAKGATIVGGFLLGGAFGGTVSKVTNTIRNKFGNTKIGQFLENRRIAKAKRVYIVGGQLDNGENDSILETALSNAHNNVENNNKKSKTGKIKSTTSKIFNKGKKILSSKKGKLATGAILGTGLVLGASAMNNHNKKKETPEKAMHDLYKSPQGKKMINNSFRQAEGIISKSMPGMENKNPEQARSILLNAKFEEDKNINSISRTYNIESKKQMEITKNSNKKIESKESRAVKNEEFRNKPMTPSLVGTQSNFEDFPSTTAEDMVKKYREYVKRDQLHENALFDKYLNKDEKRMYGVQKYMGAVTGRIYRPDNLSDLYNGKKSIGQLVLEGLANFITSPFKFMANFIGGVGKLAASAAKSVWNGIKSLGKGIVNFIKNPLGSIKNMITTGVSAVKNGWNKVKDAVGGFFGKLKNWLFGGSNDDNNSGNSSGEFAPSGDMSWAGSGDMPLGTKMVMYGSLFLPNGSIRYTQDQNQKTGRYGINNQGNTADCSSYVQHVYKVTSGVDPGPNSSSQANAGTRISNPADLKPGDILWKSGHVGLYAGNNSYLNVGGSPDPELVRIKNGFGGFTCGRRVINPDQKVGPGLNNPNLKVTKLSGPQLDAAAAQRSASLMGTSVEKPSTGRSGINPRINSSKRRNTPRPQPMTLAVKRGTGDAPIKGSGSRKPINLKPYVEHAEKYYGSAKVDQPKTNDFNTMTLTPINNLKEMSNEQKKKDIEEAKNLLNTKSMVMMTPVDTIKSITKVDQKSRIDDLSDYKRQLATESKMIKNTIAESKSSETKLLECMVDLMKKLENGTVKLKNNENILIVNKIKQLVNNINQGETENDELIRNISKEIKLIAGGF